MVYPANELKIPEIKQTNTTTTKRHIEALQVYKGMMKKQGNVCCFCVIHALTKNTFHAKVSTQTQD